MITTLDIAILTFMKKLSKEQIEKRNRIKQYLLRSLHIICYVMSALFIIICIAVGVQSCNSKKAYVNKLIHRDNEMALIDDIYQEYYVYDFNYKTNAYTREQLEGRIIKNYDDSVMGIDTSVPLSDYDVYYYFPLNHVYLLPEANYQETDLIDIVEMVVIMRPATFGYNGATYGRYRLESIKFTCAPDTYHQNEWSFIFFQKYNSDLDNENYSLKEYTNYWFISPILSKNIVFDDSHINFSAMFTSRDMINFKLNNRLLCNIGLGVSSDDYFVSNSSYTSESLIQYYIDTGVFISNGKAYNRICLNYISPSVDNQFGILRDDGSHTLLKTKDAVFAYMTYEAWVFDGTYIRYSSGDKVFEREEVYRYIGGDQSYRLYTNNFIWYDDNYQFLSFTEIDSNNYNKIVWLNSGSDTGTIKITGGLYDVFSLIGLAMTSWVSIFNIEIMPYMTIGLFLFIPFTIGLVILIFRMVKK